MPAVGRLWPSGDDDDVDDGYCLQEEDEGKVLHEQGEGHLCTALAKMGD